MPSITERLYLEVSRTYLLDSLEDNPHMKMRTSSRMDNAKKWLGLSFCFMMNLITTVLSGTSRPPSKGQGQSLSDNLLLHQRMKRSWVWNQFFVLEEYTGTDPLYVGKVRSCMWDGEWEIYYSCEMVNGLKNIRMFVVNFTKEGGLVERDGII